MKKSILILGVSLVVFSENALADWSTTRYFQCAVTKKFTARAKLKKPGDLTYSWTYDSGCGYAETTNSSEAVTQDMNNHNAYVWVRCDGSNSNQRSGWSTNGWSWGSNVDYLAPNFSFAPMYSKGNPYFENKENLTAGTFNDQGIDFDEKSRTISIKNINAFLQVNSQDLKNNFSTFQVKIYTFVMHGEESVPSKMLWSAKASIINGELFLEGNFNHSDFKNNSKDMNKIFSIDNITKSIHLDESINIEDVCVQVSGDGGNYGIGVSDEYSPNLESSEGLSMINEIESNTNFNFITYIENETISSRITKNSENKKVEEVLIMSLDGRIIIKENILNEITSVNISDLQPAPYLYVIRIGDEYFSKKFIK